MRILFTTQAGSGHWRPMLPLAQALAAAGHDVAFAATPIACATLGELGFRCFPIGIDDWLVEPEAAATAQHDPTTPAATVWVDVFVNIRAQHALPDLLATCEAWQPDLLVRESTEFAGCVAAERAGIPHAAVQVGAWRPDLHTLIGPALDDLRARAGLPLDPARAMPFRYLLLTPVPGSFLDPAQPLPATAHPMRYVPFDIGPDADPAEFGEQPPHVRIERYVPQSLLLPHCDLVVCHGGFGTVLTALRAGLPLVIIPIAADQPDNARRCAELGVAEVIGSGQGTPGVIREAVQTVMRNSHYRRSAERLRDEMRATPDLNHAVALLEQLAVTFRSPCW